MIMKPFTTFRRVLLTVAGAIMTLSFLSSCLKQHNDSVDTPVAGLMVFNVSPEQPAVGFAISGNSLTNAPIGYGTYNGMYQNIYPGDRQLAAYDYHSGAVLYADTTAGFIADKYYSAFFAGADSNYRVILVQDNFDSLSATSGSAYIRYVNAVADSIAIPEVTISAGGNNVIQQAAAFGSVSPFTAVAPGSISIAVKNANGLDVSRTIPVEAKQVYTVLLTGIQGSTSTPVEIKYIGNGTLTDEPATSTIAVPSGHSVQ